MPQDFALQPDLSARKGRQNQPRPPRNPHNLEHDARQFLAGMFNFRTQGTEPAEVVFRRFAAQNRAIKGIFFSGKQLSARISTPNHCGPLFVRPRFRHGCRRMHGECVCLFLDIFARTRLKEDLC